MQDLDDDIRANVVNVVLNYSPECGFTVIEAITQDCLVHLLLRRITTLTVSVSGI